MDAEHDPRNPFRFDPDGVDEDSPCPWGCLFHKGHLQGDCRVPWSSACWCNKKNLGRTCDKEWVVDVPNFRWYCDCETPDEWYPTVDGKVRLTVVKLTNGQVRICIWGGDDDGMEKDLDIPFNAAIVQAELVPVPITKAWLCAHGYVQA